MLEHRTLEPSWRMTCLMMMVNTTLEIGDVRGLTTEERPKVITQRDISLTTTLSNITTGGVDKPCTTTTISDDNYEHNI